jgi:glycosyltransferase involved in cell wall biosynthesis
MLNCNITMLDTSEIDLSALRVAIVHYWFVARAGGERVVECLAELFPQADVYSLIVDETKLAPSLRSHKFHVSFLQHIPLAKRFHRHFLPLHPIALEQFDLSDYDLVLSSESGAAKGVITSPNTCHICYCHSPMRYIWDMYPAYSRGMPLPTRALFTVVAHYLRLWDYASAARVDAFLANSHFVASRIRKYYGRTSTVIYPPVDAQSGSLHSSSDESYLAVGRLVDYKRFDLAIQACTALGRKLTVIGDGPEYKALRRAAGPTIRFLGSADDAELRANYSVCRALLFPGEEDFGIVPVEAQSFGKPVIAYASGGVLESVRGIPITGTEIQNPTGVFFTDQTSAGLQEAILRFEKLEDSFSPTCIRAHALQFDRAVFRERIRTFVQRTIAEFRAQN